jgi:lactate dehydrogenase-like 2-hydroxyacid dehydrogenase
METVQATGGKPGLLVMRKPSEDLLARLEQRYTLHRLYEASSKDEMLARVAPEIHAILTFGGPVDRALMQRFPNLRIVSTWTVGYDAIDVDAASERGIVVTNTPDVLTDEVADLTIGLLIATLREIPRAEAHLRAGKWKSGAYPVTASLRGRRVGIVGLGRIGRAIARRLEGFDVPIAYNGRRQQADVAYTYVADLKALAEDSDVLIVATPGGAGTKQLIGADILKALGPQGVLVNIARGSVIDEAALTAALKDGTILAAGLDVFENEPNVPDALIALPNTVLLPHVASATETTRYAMESLAVDNLLALIEGRDLPTPVNDVRPAA